MSDQGMGTGDPGFTSALQAMVTASGGRVWLNNGFSSVADHVDAWNKAADRMGSPQAADGVVGVPGSLSYFTGTAADVGGDLAWAHDNAAKYGLSFPSANQPGHIQQGGAPLATTAATSSLGSIAAASDRSLPNGLNAVGNMLMGAIHMPADTTGPQSGSVDQQPQPVDVQAPPAEQQPAQGAAPAAQPAPSPSIPQASGSIGQAGGGIGQAAVAAAMRWQGTPYQWGGTGKGGIDCSGLTQQVYASLGVNLPRTTYEQVNAGQGVPSLDQAQAGDLIFLHPGVGGPGHVGIYLGNGQIIDANHTGGSVGVRTLQGYGAIVAIRRVLPDGTPSSPAAPPQGTPPAPETSAPGAAAQAIAQEGSGSLDSAPTTETQGAGTTSPTDTLGRGQGSLETLGSPTPPVQATPAVAPPLAAAQQGAAPTGGDALGRFMGAIRQVESSSNYAWKGNAVGAMGAYQILNSNWPEWAKEAGVDPNDHSPGAQDKVAAHKMSALLQAYKGNWNDVAMAWFSGGTNPSASDGNITAGEYAQRVRSAGGF